MALHFVKLYCKENFSSAFIIRFFAFLSSLPPVFKFLAEPTMISLELTILQSSSITQILSVFEPKSMALSIFYPCLY